jgi:pilus assembly protein FimV
MLRRLLPLLTALMLFTASLAYALSLGDLTVQSGPGQPFAARIDLTDFDGISPGDISVFVAAQAEYDRFGLERNPVLDSLRLSIEFIGTDRIPILQINSPVPVDESVLNLILDIRWPSGRLLTEYSVRLESPELNAQTASQGRISPARTIIESSSADTGVVEPAAGGAVAIQLESSPASDSLAPVPASPQLMSDLSNASTITVNSGDTLWQIALRVRPDSSISVQQTMLALQRLNPDAFINNNINQLRLGEILRVPELSEIRSLDLAEAMAEVTRQNQALGQPGNVSGASQPVTVVSRSAGAPGEQGELRLVLTVDDPASQPVDVSAVGDQQAQASQQLQELEDRLAMRSENLDRLDAENNELTMRLSMLQQQITSAQEIIRLRDLELAQLQQAIAEQEAAAPAPPPTIITMAPDAGPFARLMNAIVNNTWALIGGGLAMILLLVLVLVWRTRSNIDHDKAGQDEGDMLTDISHSDELLFSGVAAAAAAADDERQSLNETSSDTKSAVESDVFEQPFTDDNISQTGSGDEPGSEPGKMAQVPPDIGAEEAFSDIDDVDEELEFEDLAFLSTEDIFDDEDDEAGDDGSLAFLSDSDEAATKLDLARAYVDMGDAEGAREILNEVLQEGTERQRSDAQSLLDRI